MHGKTSDVESGAYGVAVEKMRNWYGEDWDDYVLMLPLVALWIANNGIDSLDGTILNDIRRAFGLEPS